jgi:RecA-family ATPase
MSSLPEQTPNAFDKTQAVALKLGNVYQAANFCTFSVQGGKKIPRKRDGSQGVARDTPADALFNTNDVWAMEAMPHGEYFGLVLQKAAVIPDKGHLVVLDVDLKHSQTTTNIAIQKMARWVKANNALTEISVSGKGRHVFLVCRQADNILPKYKLAAGQEVEVFGLDNSAGKSVLLSGSQLSGEVIEVEDLHALLTEWGVIEQHTLNQPAPAPQAPIDFSPIIKPQDDYARAANALQFISPDIEYDQWIEIGQALHTAFGSQGHDLWDQWSASGSKYKGQQDIDTHWKSFHQGKGVTLGTLFHTAKQAGWEPPTKSSERRSAVDEFQNLLTPVSVATGSLYEPVTPKSNRWQAVPLQLDAIEPIDYLIDGFFAHSFAVIAGQPGVGKTTAMLAVALIAAGFKIGDAGLKAEARRKIIYVSEDTAQVRRSLYAYAKYMNLDRQELQNYFVLVESIRSTADQVLELAHLVLEHTIDNERPWLIIDTANATLDIENENDNSQVGAFMAALKQTIYTQLKTSITIITHTAKTMATSDDSAMARGASAYTGDATLTAVLFMDEEKNRYLRLVKTRYEPPFREIMLVSQIHTEAVLNRHGNLQEVKCVIVAPQSSSETDRKQLQADKQHDKQNQRLQDKCDQAVLFVQDIINQHQLVTIRKGSNCPKNPPPELANHYKLEWSEIYANVPGSDRGDTKKAIGTAIFHHFNPTDLTNLWVQLA